MKQPFVGVSKRRGGDATRQPSRTWQMGIVVNSAANANSNSAQYCWIQLDKFDVDVNHLLKTELPKPCKWHSPSKRWLFPLKWETCTGIRKIANKFGAQLRVTDGMAQWANDEAARQATIPDVNSMELIDLPIVRQSHPGIWDAISSRPFQSVGAAFAARNRSCLIADQPGLGKTIQSIAAVLESGISGPILVVAPKQAARLTWPQELKRWVGDDPVYTIGSNLTPHERAATVKEIGSLTKRPERIWVITSPNYLRVKIKVDNAGNYVKPKEVYASGEGLVGLLAIEWSAIIVDESHQTLAGATGNKKKQSAQRLGLGELRTKHEGLRIALSGTPFRGKEEYLWGQLNFLRPDLYTAYWNWINKYFDSWRDRYGMNIGRMVDAEGMYQEAKSVMIRRTKAEVAKDLPPKMYGGWPLNPKIPGSPVAVWLPMVKQQAQAYASMHKEAAVLLDGGSLMANGLLAEMTRLKQFAGSYGMMSDGEFFPTLPSNKFDWIQEFLDERGIDKDAGEDQPKIVIASQFSKLINIIYSGLAKEGISAYKFTGATSDRDRESIKQDWQENPASKTRVLLLTTTAGGVSLTLDAASELVICDETWNFSDQEQLEDRLHRLSRMHQVMIWNLRSLGTIEESIAKNNLGKENSIRDIIDGERGVEFVRSVMGA